MTSIGQPKCAAQEFLILGKGMTTHPTGSPFGPGRRIGCVAGNARRQSESKSGRKVVTRDNYLIEKPKPKLAPKSK